MRDFDSVNRSMVIPQQCQPAAARSLRQIVCTMAAIIILGLPLGLTASAQSQAKPQANRATSQAGRTMASTGRQAPASKTHSEPDLAWLQEALKNPDLLAAVGHIQERLEKELQYPPPLNQSRILPRLGDATVFYAALPNFGQQVHQAQQIFQEELHASPALQDFLRKNKLNEAEPKFEEGLQKFYEFSQYLGEELVITGGLKGKEPTGVLIAEVRKPGLKAFLEKIALDLGSKPGDQVRILDPQQLAMAANAPSHAPVVLVRPDFMLIGLDTATLRDFNAQLDKGGSSFATNALGKRLAQAYQSGSLSLIGADLQKLVALIPQNPPQTRLMLDKAGFSDVKYALAETRQSGKNTSSEMELVFNGPRRGVASWIAAPAPLGALDFMSSKAYVAEAFKLKNLAQIFDDIVELAGPAAFASLPQMEAQFNVNLKQDILSKLSGELAFELQTPPIPAIDPATGQAKAEPPQFKVVLSVSDQAGLQRTLKRLLAEGPLQAQERVEDGVTYYALAMPSATGDSAEVNYFFMDGYLVVASTRAMAREAVRVHRSGESVARLQQVGGQGHVPKASFLAYQNAGPMLAAIAKQLPPEIAGPLSRFLSNGEVTTNVAFGYADETSLRGTMNSNVAMNAGAVMIVAAVAIPNLLRSRIAANEAAAAATVRTVNTAEITYSVAYPRKGYAPTLAVMGPGASGDCSESSVNAAHACLLDNVVGSAECTAGKWCEKNGYRYIVRGICLQTSCRGYVVTATPVNENTGKKNFCSTVDAVVRAHEGPPLTAPLTVAECKAWAPLGGEPSRAAVRQRSGVISASPR